MIFEGPNLETTQVGPEDAIVTTRSTFLVGNPCIYIYKPSFAMIGILSGG